MVPETPVASIVSPSFAVASASRNEPDPLSLVFVTTMMLVGLATLCLVAFRCANANGITQTAASTSRQHAPRSWRNGVMVLPFFPRWIILGFAGIREEAKETQRGRSLLRLLQEPLSCASFMRILGALCQVG